MIFLGSLCTAFLLGSIPTGLWVARWAKGVDVRQLGSGNVGATNVARVVGKLPGALVLLVDTAKGWVPVTLLASQGLEWGVGVAPDTFRVLLGIAAVAGHIWNPFLQFRGGRGVATALGLLWGLDPLVGFGCLVVWILVAFTSRYVSVASISASLFAPFFMALLGAPTAWVLGGIAVSIAIIARHRENILRLLHGEENRFRSKK